MKVLLLLIMLLTGCSVAPSLPQGSLPHDGKAILHIERHSFSHNIIPYLYIDNVNYGFIPIDRALKIELEAGFKKDRNS